MPKLPVLSGKEMIRILEKAGFKVLDQQGSHVIMLKEAGGKRLKPVVPLHGELKVGTLISIMRQAEINREELFRLL